MSNAKIVDISMYNTIQDTTALAQFLDGGVGIRAGQKTWMDEHYLEHVAKCRLAGISFFVWWFMHPDYSGDAQALKFIELYAMLGDKHRVFLDCEGIDYKLRDGTPVKIYPISKDQYTHDISIWLSKVEAQTGIVPGIYTAYWFWMTWVHPKGTVYNYEGIQYTAPDWSKYPLWVANWDVVSPMIPHGWSQWKLWQWGAQVTPGIWNVNPGDAETDSDWFNGISSDAKAWLRYEGGTPPPLDITKIKLGWPCNRIYPISQRFGEHPENYRIWRLPGHEGLDFATPSETSIFSMQNGTVTEIRPAFNGNPYGNCVVLGHVTEGINYRTFYAHLRSCSVVVGQTVSKGQTVGLSGSTGNSTGPHLHVTVKVVGYQTPGWPAEYCDPLLLLTGEPVPPVEGVWYNISGNMFVRTIPDGNGPKAPFGEWLKPGDRVLVTQIINGWGMIRPARWFYTLSKWAKKEE